MISEEIRKLIENNPVFIGTSFKDLPNITVVDGVKVLENEKILISDVQMTSCNENIINNPNCCLVVYDSVSEFGYKIFGQAEYHTSGKELELANNAISTPGLTAKGAIVVTVSKFLEVN